MQKAVSTAFFVAIIALSQLAFGAGSEKLILSGSSTIAPLILEIAKKFEKANPNVRVDVQTGGSSRGVRDARQGLADIGMASRALKKNEQGLQSFTIALDGVGILVHRDLSVSNLKTQDLVKIFTGQSKNWKEFGGPDQKITVINRAEGRSELEMFCQHLAIKPSQIRASMIVGENAHGVKTIAQNKYAITYLSIGHVLKEAELGVPVKVLALDGVEAIAKTVGNGNYPIARPLNLVTKSVPVGMQKKFIEYAKSGLVHGIIKNQSFVPAAH